MNMWIKMLSLISISLLIVACDNNDNDTGAGAPQEKAYLRVLHASADTPSVNIWLNGEVAFENVDFADSTAVTSLPAGMNDLQVEGIISSGNAVIIDAQDVELTKDMLFDVVVLNTYSAIEPLIVSKDKDFDGEVRVQVVHAASAAPEVDVHLTAPVETLSVNTVWGSVAFKESLDPISLAAGSYRIRMTAKDDLTPLYDSGSFVLNTGADVLIAAVTNTQMGDSVDKSPIALSIVSDSGSTLAYSVDDGAEASFVHSSSDAPALDVYIQELVLTAFTNVAFASATDYVALEQRPYTFDVRITGTLDEIISNIDLVLQNSELYTIVAVGDALDENAGDSIRPQPDGLELLLLTDEPRSVATDARLRVVHGAFEAPTVDVYLTATTDTSTATAVISDFKYKDSSAYLLMTQGSYFVTLYAAGSDPAMDDFAMQTGPIILNNGGVYTAIARAATVAESPATFGVTVIAD